MFQIIRSALWFALFASTQVGAQAYPSKPVRVLVPFPPGGGVDVVARLVAQNLSTTLGQPMVVDNRAGADGAIATEATIRSAPDGYTLLLGISTPITDIAMLRKVVPYDAFNGITPIAQIGRFPFFLMIHPDVPAKNVAELVSYARANPGKLSNGTGNGAAALITAMFSKGAGVSVTNVPYKGEGVAVTDLASGRVQMMFIGSTNPALGLAKDGKLRALAVLLQNRSPLAPDLPTLAEAGFPGIGNAGFLALFGPAKLPSEITMLLSRTVNEILGRTDVRAALAQQAFEIATATPDELAALLRQTAVRMKQVYTDAGIEPQ